MNASHPQVFRISRKRHISQANPRSQVENHSQVCDFIAKQDATLATDGERSFLYFPRTRELRADIASGSSLAAVPIHYDDLEEATRRKGEAYFVHTHPVLTADNIIEIIKLQDQSHIERLAEELQVSLEDVYLVLEEVKEELAQQQGPYLQSVPSSEDIWTLGIYSFLFHRANPDGGSFRTFVQTRDPNGQILMVEYGLTERTAGEIERLAGEYVLAMAKQGHNRRNTDPLEKITSKVASIMEIVTTEYAALAGKYARDASSPSIHGLAARINGTHPDLHMRTYTRDQFCQLLETRR